MKELGDFCRLFYAAHYLPIALYGENGFICSAGHITQEDPYPFVYEKLRSTGSPSVYVSSDTGYFGLVSAGDGKSSFIIGPTYSTPVTDSVIRAFMKKNAIALSSYSETEAFLSNIPTYSYNQFLNLLLYLHYTFTGESLELSQAFNITDTAYQSSIGQQLTEKSFYREQEQREHGTYSFERQMIDFVKSGDVNGLNKFLLAAAKISRFNEGKLADTPLRQAKNIFIGFVTIIGKDAAIPGGLDIEQTYQLIDTYIQECEKLQTVEAVKNLQYNMPLDFAKRVAQQKLPENVSSDIFECIQFISSHSNELIGVDEVVEHIGKSRAYLQKKFAQEIGMGIGAYITKCRLREAEHLLRFTDKSLSEISSYLCFSSQSHFQNVFKKSYGITPAEFRKLGKR